MSSIAIVLASGGGTRFGGTTPKQFLDIFEKPVIAFTLTAFERAQRVDGIVVVCNAEWIPFVRRIVARYAFRKIIDVIEGGETRQASSLAGIRFAMGRGANVLLTHDAVRPLIDPEVIDEAIRRVDETGVVDVVAKTTDTIVRSDGATISDIPERAYLYSGQTPQVFRAELALQAHEHALAQGITNASDDVQLALKLGAKPVIVHGGSHNIKITVPVDLEIAKALLARRAGLSQVTRLTEPFVFEEVARPQMPTGGQVEVRPILGSICAADLRYYSGQRRPEALAKKLPMALLHEGIGVIVSSSSPTLPPNTRVVIVPHLQRCEDEHCRACHDEAIGANFCPRNGFLSSGEDGMTQTLLTVHPDNAVPIPDGVPDNVAVMAESLSIVVAALRRCQVGAHDRLAVIGPGPVGYAAQIMLEEVLQRPVPLVGPRDPMPEADFYFEAVGGEKSSTAINAAIAAAPPGATIALLGVSENPVAINTRDILQKGLRLFGSSRSTPADIARTVAYMARPTLCGRIEKLVIARDFQPDQLVDALEFALKKSEWGKVIIRLAPSN